MNSIPKNKIDWSIKFGIKTPVDKRTWERKKLIERTKEVVAIECSDYGMYAFLRVSDKEYFENFNLN